MLNSKKYPLSCAVCLKAIHIIFKLQYYPKVVHKYFKITTNEKKRKKLRTSIKTRLIQLWLFQV